ncbi:MAG: ABC transporter substrate-binding protein [bacterium]
MRRLFSVILIISMLISVFEIGLGVAIAQTKKDVVLTEIISQGWTNDADEALAKKFTEETGIKIDRQIVPAAQYHDLLKAKLNAGEAPDIFWSQTNPFAIKTELDPEKNCVDFTNEKWVKVMNPQRIPSVSYKGKVYGLTLWPNSPEYTFFYNKTLFRKLGFLKPPTTYQDFKKICTTILNAGITPIYEFTSQGWHQVLPFAQIGGRYQELYPGLYDKLNNNQIKFVDISTMALVLKQMKETADLGFYGKDFLANDGTKAVELLGTRKVAMTLGNPGLETQIRQAHPECKDEFGLFLIPYADNQTYPFNPNGPARFAYKMGKYINEVKQYFEFLTRKDNLQYKLDNTPEWTNIDVTVDIKQRWLPMEKELMRKIPHSKYKLILQSGVKYFNEQWMEVGKDIEALYIGAITPEQILKNIDERREKMAKAQSDPAWK